MIKLLKTVPQAKPIWQLASGPDNAGRIAEIKIGANVWVLDYPYNFEAVDEVELPSELYNHPTYILFY